MNDVDPKPGSLIFLQDYQPPSKTDQRIIALELEAATPTPSKGSHNAPSEKLEPFTWGEKRMDTKKKLLASEQDRPGTSGKHARSGRPRGNQECGLNRTGCLSGRDRDHHERCAPGGRCLRANGFAPKPRSATGRHRSFIARFALPRPHSALRRRRSMNRRHLRDLCQDPARADARKSDVVILDNCQLIKSPGRRAGLRPMRMDPVLPPTARLNPSNGIRKTQSPLRRRAIRTIDALWKQSTNLDCSSPRMQKLFRRRRYGFT